MKVQVDLSLVARHLQDTIQHIEQRRSANPGLRALQQRFEAWHGKPLAVPDAAWGPAAFKVLRTALLELAADDPDWLDKRTMLTRLMMAIDDLEPAPKVSVSDLLTEAEAEVQGEVARVEAAIQRADWNGTPVRLKVQPGEEHLTAGVQVYVGPWSFSLEENGVEDLLEAGDTDFFDASTKPQMIMDYFHLAQELQKPGSSTQGKDLVLYSARPVRDRQFYERATSVPPGLFLTNRPDRAVGLAQTSELGGERDVWRMVINSRYLLTTLDRGSVKDFQIIAAGSVPAKVSLYEEHSRVAHKLARRVAAEYQRRPLS